MNERLMRAGEKFYKEIEKIQDKRLILGKDRNRMATSKILNMIVSHVNWDSIKKSLISANTQEVELYGAK